MSVARITNNVPRNLAMCRLHPLLCATVLFLAVATDLNAQTDAHKTVLVLYDGGRDFSSIRLIDRQFESTLVEALSSQVTIFREYMDLTRFRPPNYEQVLRDFYRSKYSVTKPDVIVAVRGRPLDFLLNSGDEVFPGVPIVSSGMDLRQVRERNLPANVTGSSLRVRYWPTLALARRLQPETEQVALVIGASPNDWALEALVRDELREHERELKFTYLSGLRVDDLMERVATLAPRTIILFVSFAQDGNGRSFMPNDALTRNSRAANAPTYITSDDVADYGAVGGDLISFAELGKDTASVALRILQGESPQNIQFTEFSTRVKMLDARQLERWEIPVARVPSDALVLNRVPTLWQAYRWRIVGGIVLIALQTVLIATLLVQRRRRRIAEQNLQISEANKRAAVLEERNRMARDMHDTLAQGFTGVIVQLQAAQQAVAHGSTADTDAHIHRASDLARQSLDEARRSIRALRPQALEEADLCAALADETKQLTAGTGVRAEFAVRGHPYPLPPSSEENLLRIHQEILTNVLKHANAKSIKATLSFEQSNICLDVADDGTGFDLGNKHESYDRKLCMT